MSKYEYTIDNKPVTRKVFLDCLACEYSDIQTCGMVGVRIANYQKAENMIRWLQKPRNDCLITNKHIYKAKRA